MPIRIPPAAYALALIGVLGAAFRILSPSPEGVGLGSPAPSFRLADVNGRSAGLSDYRGRVVLLDFWATWCDICRSELPMLKVLHAKYQGKDFELLAPSVDEGSPRKVADFVAANDLPYPVLIADYPTIRGYRVSGLPAKFLIGRDGTIAARYIGPSDAAQLEADIKNLLKSSANQESP